MASPCLFNPDGCLVPNLLIQVSSVRKRTLRLSVGDNRDVEVCPVVNGRKVTGDWFDVIAFAYVRKMASEAFLESVAGLTDIL